MKNNQVIKSSNTSILFFISFVSTIIISIAFKNGFLILGISSSVLFSIWFTSKVYYRLYLNDNGFELIFPTRVCKFRKMTYHFDRTLNTSNSIGVAGSSILDRVVIYERASVRSGHTLRFYSLNGEPAHVSIEMSTARVQLFLHHLKGKANVEVCHSLKSYYSNI
ncbi:MAG: hypothetical protein RL204_462 [Bacteroidota bacterium]|jgi:hypothetical protein